MNTQGKKIKKLSKDKNWEVDLKQLRERLEQEEVLDSKDAVL